MLFFVHVDDTTYLMFAWFMFFNLYNCICMCAWVCIIVFIGRLYFQRKFLLFMMYFSKRQFYNIFNDFASFFNEGSDVTP